MNIEDLSKTQLLLLTILVNFVTSIATGVLTVSLLDQAPVTVQQTVNRIVDNTIETVASPLPNILPTKETTVVVKDEDLLTVAIAANSARTVKLYARATSTPALATATYLVKSRALVTTTSAVLPKEILVEFPDGTVAPASLAQKGATLTIYGFSDTASLPQTPLALLVPLTEVKQGQTAIALGKDGSASIGIITKVTDEGIHTNLTNIPAGSAAVNSSGNLLGISLDGLGTFASADKISTLLSATSSPEKK